VVWGWGKYSVRYAGSTGAQSGSYRCYTAPVPWPVASGRLPAEITHTVVGYGDIWFFSPVETVYSLQPLGPNPVLPD
jgi:hypothetical protein